MEMMVSLLLELGRDAAFLPFYLYRPFSGVTLAE
jgi:hypothetical protein